METNFGTIEGDTNEVASPNAQSDVPETSQPSQSMENFGDDLEEIKSIETRGEDNSDEEDGS